MAEPGQEDFPPLPPDQEKPFFPSPNTPPKDSDSIINYRGNRMYKDDIALEVAQTRCERLDENTIALEIIFNQSINPRSMGHESIYIDGEPLPDGTRFLFNRRGDTIKILIIMYDDEFSMKVQNIQSFNGKLIEPAIFEVELPDEEEAEDEAEAAEPEASELPPLTEPVFTDE